MFSRIAADQVAGRVEVEKRSVIDRSAFPHSILGTRRDTLQIVALPAGDCSGAFERERISEYVDGDSGVLELQAILLSRWRLIAIELISFYPEEVGEQDGCDLICHGVIPVFDSAVRREDKSASLLDESPDLLSQVRIHQNQMRAKNDPVAAEVGLRTDKVNVVFQL